MKRNLCRTLCLIVVASSFSLSDLMVAQAQNSTPASSEAKSVDVTHGVQVQLLVGSNLANAKTDYPASLEAVVRQLKSSLQFKNYYLVATHLYNVADGSAFEVSDVTYAAFEQGGATSPTFFSFAISGIKSNPNSDSIHISRLRFEARKRIFIQHTRAEDGTVKPVVETAGMGITTELNVRAGTPSIVGTTASGLSDAVLVLLITVNPSGGR